MADDEKRKGGGAKTSRSETVTVRLSPQSRYLAEIGARLQRRTLSSFIEWAVEKATEDVDAELWDVDPMDRLATLALKFPALLTYEEQLLWKMVRETFTLIGDKREFTGTLADRELLRRFGWAFQTAVDKNTPASEVAKALSGDKELQNELCIASDLDIAEFESGPTQRSIKALADAVEAHAKKTAKQAAKKAGG